MTLLTLCEWLEATALGAVARESLYGFQVLVGAHILGLILSVGTLLWVDLRMIGASLQAGRLSDVYRSLSPWFLSGFAVMLVSGSALFAGFATSAYGNAFFRIKLISMTLAGINAFAFHRIMRNIPSGVDAGERPPRVVRMAGAISLALWAVVVLCGRMMSYTMF